MSDEKLNETEKAFDDAILELLKNNPDIDEDEMKKALSNHPLCEIIYREETERPDSSCPSGIRVYVSIIWQCDGRERRTYENWCK